MSFTTVYKTARELIINEMVEHRELIRRGDDIYEDMDGHLLHESNLDDYIKSFLENLPKEELTALMTRIKGDI